MKITRRQLRTLIESVLREEKTMSKDDARKLQIALSNYIQKGEADQDAMIALGGILMSMGVFGAQTGSGMAAGSIATAGNPFAIAIGGAALAGLGVGTMIDQGFAINTKTFKNQVIRRAADSVGLEVGRYSQPSIEDVAKKGGKLNPRKVDAAFNRQLALLQSLSQSLEGEKPEMVRQYEELVEAGLIDSKEYEKIAKSEEQKIKQALKSLDSFKSNKFGDRLN